MGILTTYAAYRYGKHRAEREYMLEICDHCGHTREEHDDPDGACLCPVQN